MEIKELARRFPRKDRQSGSLAPYESIRCLRRPILHMFKVPVSRLSPAHAQHGIRILWGRP